MEEIDLLHDISNIVLNAETHDKALNQIVSHLNKYLESDVCSIYLLNQAKNVLVLSATDGLHEDAVGNVSMEPAEGLTGKVFSSRRYLIVNQASKHAGFKYFPGIGEEPFDTFIGIPLQDEACSFGVLVFQFKETREPDHVMEKLLTTVASIVSVMVIRFNLLASQGVTEQIRNKTDQVLHGVALSEGIAIGTPVLVINEYIESSQEHFDADEEIRNLERAFAATGFELKELINQIEENSEQISVDIFHAHLMMIQDGSYKKDMIHHLVDYNKGAAFAIRHVSDKFIRRFLSIPDPYLKERASDIQDICQRLLANLGVLNREIDLQEDSILITDSLTPGETASLDMEKVGGFITEKDGPTSHTAILARSRQIPAVSGIPNLLGETELTHTIIIDGFEGNVILNPSDIKLDEYRRKQSEFRRAGEKQEDYDLKKNGLIKHGIRVYANVSSVLDAEKARSLEADGIGLVRTEIFYLQKKNVFDHETQVDFYRQIVKNSPQGPIVFRLLDIGADKQPRLHAFEPNPALGCRGLRLLLQDRELLHSQVRALLTVSAEASIRLLIPFITEVQEFLEVKELISSQAEKLQLTPPPIGAMIEIPSVAFILEELSQQADFFSIGTNDLFQYFCAVDRNNPQVVNRYSPDTPSFIRLLDLIYQKTRQYGKEAEICGEMAADPSILNQLLDIGYKRFSINPYSIRTTRKALSRRF